jgi:hypothetical protein
MLGLGAADTGGGIIKIPRVLVGDLVVAASAVGTPLVISNQADGDFEFWFLAISRTSALLKLKWAESGSTRKFIYSGTQPPPTRFDGVSVDNLAGTVAGNGAFPIAVPYVFTANRQMEFEATDASAAQNTLQVVLHGYLLLQVSQGQQAG